MKKTLLIVTMFLLVFTSIFAGGSQEAAKPKQQDSLMLAHDWAAKAGLNQGVSSQELYKKALETEGGKVVVYSISSRMARVKAAFEADYPGMTVESYDISSNDMATKLRTEYEAGIRTADVIHSKEQNGEYLMEFFAKGILHNYQPASIFGNVDPQYLKDLTPLYFETDWWFYNTSVYQESPISNWWDITKPEWKGKFIIQNPLGTVSYMAIITTMVEHADEMASAYKTCYGKDIVLAKDEPTAAHAWIKRVLANDPIIMDSNNEVIKAVGEGTTSALIGYAPSSKYREKTDKGWNIDVNPAVMVPMSGVPFMNFVAVVNEAPHPYGAQLLIRYMLGDENGNGKGIQPFNTIGGWTVRPETKGAEGNIPFQAMPLWNLNYEYIYDNLQDVQDYWYQFR